MNPKVETAKFKDSKRTARKRLTCDCGCAREIDIYIDRDGAEVGGVHGTASFWREIFRPLFDK